MPSVAEAGERINTHACSILNMYEFACLTKSSSLLSWKKTTANTSQRLAEDFVSFDHVISQRWNSTTSI